MIGRASAIGLALLSLVAAGCGSSGGGSSYDADAVANCLDGRGLADVDPDRSNVDFIAGAASGGALRAEFGGREVIVSFYRDSSDAKDAEDAYEQVPGEADGNLMRKGNAVIAWTDTPTDEERDAMDQCFS